MFLFTDLEDQCWSFIVNENLFSEDTAFALFREARKKGMTPVMDLMVNAINHKLIVFCRFCSLAHPLKGQSAVILYKLKKI